MGRSIKLFMATAVAAGGLGLAAPAQHAAADPLPTLRVGDVSVTEGDAGSAVVNVPLDLSGPSALKVTVTYDITSTSATAGVDFQSRHAKIAFAVGSTSKFISVRVYGDTVPDPGKVVDVTLSSPVNAAIDDGQGSVTIVDDDDGGSAGLRANIGDVTIQEADAGTHYAYVPVTLSQPAPSAVKLRYTLDCSPGDGTDYVVRSSGTISFPIGTQSKSIRFSIPANTTPETALTFLQTITVLSGPSGIDVATGGGTVVDDDTQPGGPPPSTLGVGEIGRVSVSTNGDQAQFFDPGLCGGNVWGSTGAVISEDGRYVAYRSDAVNLVPNDTNLEWDIFEYDRLTQTTQRVSVRTDGTEAAANDGGAPYVGADNPAISADGRYVTFYDWKALVPGLDDFVGGIYIHDRVTGTTQLVSRKMDGTPDTGVVDLGAPVSADGRYVTYTSGGDGLVPNDTDPVDTNGNRTLDVFRRDMLTGTTTLVTTSYDGTPTAGFYPAMSTDGRYVGFDSWYDNIVPGDTNGCQDIFLRDMTTGSVQRIDVTSAGGQTLPTADGQCSGASWAPSISDDGTRVVFNSNAWNLDPSITTPPAHQYSVNAHVFLRDLAAGTTERVDADQGAAHDWMASISGDGNVVAYQCECGNPEVSTVMAHDLTTGDTTEVGQLLDGTLGDGPNEAGFASSVKQALSYDGSYAVFDAWSTNLIPQDTNNEADIYIERLK